MSYYLNPNNTINRLRREWNLHKHLIIAVDFDSTIHPYKDFEIAQDSEKIRNLIRELYNEGCTIIIWTAATPDRIDRVKQQLSTYNIKYHYFNENALDVNFAERKVYANAYLDDRAGLYETYTALNTLLIERKYEKVNSYFHGLMKQMSRP